MDRTTPSTSLRTSAMLNSSMSVGNASFNASFSNSISRRTSRLGGNDTVIISQGWSLCLEPYGMQLPSMVKVALNKMEDIQSVSCRVDPNGWAWLVAKKKLYIWRHAVMDGKRTAIPCRELTLPPSEIVHNAKLICVVGAAGSSIPACIAVSPEGSISYWPNIANESSTLSISADVPSGQECDSLSSIWPTGCILTTTSATVIFIKPVGGNRPLLQCMSLSLATKGWLGGLHKKINYIFPGGTSLDTKRAKVVVPISKDNPSQPGAKQSTVYLLSGTSVQVWNVTTDVQQCEIDCKSVDDYVKRLFNEYVWEGKSDVRGIQIWLLDLLCFNNGRVALLSAALNQSETNQEIHYGIVVFDPKKLKARDTTQFHVVTYTSPKDEGIEDTLYSWRLLGTQNVFYMISDERILVVSGNDPLDFITSESLGGPLLGCGHVTEGTAVVFVPKYGLLSLRWNQSDTKVISLDDTLSEIRVPDHLSLSMTQHGLGDLGSSDDSVNRYKSAFLNYCGKRLEECQEILRNLFPPNIASLTPHDPIDIFTIALCEKLVDDAPIGDARWLMSSLGSRDDQDAVGLKSKMLIKNFLLDKKEGLELFFGFLHSSNILSRLTGVVVKEDVEATVSVLFNAYEKIGFAITLHYLQSEQTYRKLIDYAIKSVIMHRTEFRAPQLSYNDLFYKDVTRIHQIFTALIAIEKEKLEETPAEDSPSIVRETTEIILVVFDELRKLHTLDKFGQVKKFLLQPIFETPNSLTVTPWFVQPSILEQFTNQAEFIVAASQHAMDTDVKLGLFVQLEQLTDFILDGLKVSLESLKGSDRYAEKLKTFELKRAKFLNNLVQIDSTASLALAEKYLDFNVLARVCYEKRDMQRMEYLFEKYVQLGFPNFTFEWFLKQRKTAELIETFSKSKFKDDLHEFLKAYPEVGWHHAAVVEDFRQSANILKRMAEKEEASVDDKKFLLCMSKLGILSSNTIQPRDEELFQCVNKDLEVVEYQNGLPDSTLAQFGLERSTMRTLSLSELIDIYSATTVEPDPKNFWKALSLCDYAVCREEKRLLVIARAILIDPWGTWSVDHPEDVIEVSVLFKLIAFAIGQGENLDNIFDIRALNNLSILQPVFANMTSNFLIHACHEHLSTGSHRS